MQPSRCCSFCLFVVLVTSGCQAKVTEVSGRLLLGGSDPEGLRLQFWHVDNMVEPRGSATTDENGVFVVSASEPRLGERVWPTGTYLVRIIDPRSFGVMDKGASSVSDKMRHRMSSSKAPPKSRVPMIYANKNTSPARVEMVEGANDLGEVVIRE